ncbi:hypothetical protein [Vibrio splendidus]|uniref:Uncharacterized protein n=1 Tax=Vibrio splendidus 12E03 TaxID=1191305 RepID=A0A1E5FEN3_VIBSP|nr:hypothetical protein A142_08305 [Vibrio splendidus 12E03]
MATHAVSFIDEIDGQLDMGEYLAENAYGFLPVPILITEPAVGYGGGFRYLIARRYGLISGIDIAFSEEDTALYFQVGAGT